MCTGVSADQESALSKPEKRDRLHGYKMCAHVRTLYRIAVMLELSFHNKPAGYLVYMYMYNKFALHT